jgi:glycerophosphoryl diester phosphodiesterase
MTTRSVFALCFALLAGLSPLKAEPVCTESFGKTATGALPKGWRVSGGEWQVKDGRLVGKGTAYLSRIFAPVGELENVAIEAEVSFLAAKKPSRWLALMVRAEKGEPRPFLIFTSRFERHKGSGLEIGFNQPIKGKREWEIHRRGSRKPALKLGETQRMRLELRSGLARAFLDGKLVLSCDVSPDVPARGEVGFVVSDVTATFDNVRIEKLAPLSEKERHEATLDACAVPLVIAHRGASRHFPENTMLAFQQAFARGADGVEMDVRLSKDGQVYLLHDDKLGKTTNGHGRAGEKTLAELQTYDAGSSKDAKFKGEPIPDFASVAAALKGKGLLFLDLKEDGLGAALAPIIRKEGILDQVVACCWRPEQVADIRKHLPEILIVKVGKVPDKLPTDFCFGWRRQGAAGFSMGHDSLSPSFVAQAAAAGMGVYSWTVNSKRELREALQLGVTGVLTDNPQHARQELRRLLAGAWWPARR